MTRCLRRRLAEEKPKCETGVRTAADGHLAVPREARGDLSAPGTTLPRLFFVKKGQPEVRLARPPTQQIRSSSIHSSGMLLVDLVNLRSKFACSLLVLPLSLLHSGSCGLVSAPRSITQPTEDRIDRQRCWLRAEQDLRANYSYDVYSYGVYSYGVYSYGLYSYGLWTQLRRAEDASPVEPRRGRRCRAARLLRASLPRGLWPSLPCAL